MEEQITKELKVTPGMLRTRKIRKAFGLKIKPYVRTSPKIQRNDSCPCGSGLKYKKCCGKNI